jgi:hypothetical protein
MCRSRDPLLNASENGVEDLEGYRLKFDVGFDVLDGRVMSYDGRAQISGAWSPRRLDIVRWRLIFSAQLLQFFFLTRKNVYHFTCTE